MKEVFPPPPPPPPPPPQAIADVGSNTVTSNSLESEKPVIVSKRNNPCNHLACSALASVGIGVISIAAIVVAQYLNAMLNTNTYSLSKN